LLSSTHVGPVTDPLHRIDDDAVDVAATAETYADDAARFVEKYRSWSLTELHGEAFRRELPDPPCRPPRVLDLGCGPGADARVFADAGFEPVGLDVTRPFLREARDDVPGGHFVQGDMRHLPVPDRAVDGIWCSAAFLHVPRSDAASTLRAFGRVLSSGCPLLLSAKARETRDGDAIQSTDGRRFTLRREDPLRRRLADAGFEPEQLSEEPDWHTFLAIRD
jgi:ubiquinone/menaquinone biosynthesis C-methylase UbiE